MRGPIWWIASFSGLGGARPAFPSGIRQEPVHLIFLFGVPQRMVTDYLVCVGAVARVVKDKTETGCAHGGDDRGGVRRISSATGSLLVE